MEAASGNLATGLYTVKTFLSVQRYVLLLSMYTKCHGNVEMNKTAGATHSMRNAFKSARCRTDSIHRTNERSFIVK